MSALRLLLASSLAVSTFANAGTLEKVLESKNIVLGVRDSSAPLSYTTGSGAYSGYHVELCEKLVDRLRRRLKLSTLPVKYVPVNSQNRIPLVTNGTVDLECGSTTNNTARQNDVAFAYTTYITEFRMATRANSPIRSVSHLEGKKVATTTGSTSVQVLRKLKRSANMNFEELFGKDHGESFLLLDTGRADVMVMDDNILAGQIALSADPSAYRMVGEVLAVEPIAIMFRKGDAELKKFMDTELSSMMKSGEVAKLYDKWFVQPIPPRNVRVNLPLSASLHGALAEPNDNPAEAYPANK